MRLGLQMIKAINTVAELYPEADLAMRIGEILITGDDDVNDNRISEILMLILITGDSDENNLDQDEGEIVLTIGYKYPLG